jgi:CRP-like cAMP-binding protein
LQESFEEGEYITREGAIGENFFIIHSGSVKVTQTISDADEALEIRKLQQGDYFGEKALLR